MPLATGDQGYNSRCKRAPVVPFHEAITYFAPPAGISPTIHFSSPRIQFGLLLYKLDSHGRYVHASGG
ncbi:hypothetical protein WG66_003031 [Moniliophthora roreri]|nr:hypothetical protein WG66_003031 [Moniliophthora roreri]